jgi:phosphate transport system substrate-binding protein
LSYPGARKLFVYFKGEHIAAKPAIKAFIEAYAKAWNPGGMLASRGLVPLGAADLSAATAQASALKPLDKAALK